VGDVKECINMTKDESSEEDIEGDVKTGNIVHMRRGYRSLLVAI
jgi:hypothetical protein